MHGRFAHISDCHIGAWREQKLRELNDLAFGRAIDLSIQNEVDFVVISGDIFDVGIPEMSSVRSAVRKLKELVDRGTPVYVVYGSHDYSPTTVSVVEVLTEAGLFSNVGEFDTQKGDQGRTPIAEESSAGKLSLKPLVDLKTRTQLAGLPARRGGLEKAFYAELKGSVAQNIDPSNYSIFVFHASVNELQALNIPIEQNISLEDLPRGFSYYAGGHLHKRSMGKIDGSPVVYPGPLFGTSYTDLELTARAERRGFAIVNFDERKTVGIDFVDLPSPKMLSKTFNAEGKSSTELDKEIRTFVSREDLSVKGVIVLLKMRGVLSQGKPSDIEFYEYRRALLERGASVVSINRMGLSTKESKRLELIGQGSKEEIESKLLSEHLSSFKPRSPELMPSLSPTSGGLAKATRLLGALKTEKKEEETKPTFEKRVIREASGILDFPIE